MLRTTALESLCHFINGWLFFYEQSLRVCYKLTHPGAPSLYHYVLAKKISLIFFIFSLFTGRRGQAMVCWWRSEDSLRELVLSLHTSSSREQHGSRGLAATAFTLCATSMPRSVPSYLSVSEHYVSNLLPLNWASRKHSPLFHPFAHGRKIPADDSIQETRAASLPSEAEQLLPSCFLSPSLQMEQGKQKSYKRDWLGANSNMQHEIRPKWSSSG